LNLMCRRIIPGLSQYSQSPLVAAGLMVANILMRANCGEPRAGRGGADYEPEKHQPCRLAGFGAALSGAGGFGEARDGTGFVVVNVKNRIEFSNL
jgi:hypothetical protein